MLSWLLVDHGLSVCFMCDCSTRFAADAMKSSKQNSLGILFELGKGSLLDADVASLVCMFSFGRSANELGQSPLDSSAR